jgi:Ulp1 family protease
VPLQPNQFDCGVFLINNVIEFLDNPNKYLAGFDNFTRFRPREDIQLVIETYLRSQKERKREQTDQKQREVIVID